jgi:hypothetical protein
MADARYDRQISGPSTTVVSLRGAMVAGFVAWLLLVWYATNMTLARTDSDDLVRVSMWAVAVVFGGLLVIYTWTVATAIIERERFRSTVERGLKLADQALEEARDLASDAARQ